MIFVTVGAQMPFDRLIGTVDEWASQRSAPAVIAQIGDTEQIPTTIEWTRQLDPESFLDHVTRADVIVSHAGMGTIITAMQHAKPLIVMPRLGSLHETRNDHQVATANRFRDRVGVHVADDERELLELLDRDNLDAPTAIVDHGAHTLTERIREFIEQ